MLLIMMTLENNDDVNLIFVMLLGGDIINWPKNTTTKSITIVQKCNNIPQPSIVDDAQNYL